MIVLLKLLSGKIDSLIVGEVRKKNFTLFQPSEKSGQLVNFLANEPSYYLPG